MLEIFESHTIMAMLIGLLGLYHIISSFKMNTKLPLIHVFFLFLGIWYLPLASASYNKMLDLSSNNFVLLLMFVLFLISIFMVSVSKPRRML